MSTALAEPPKSSVAVTRNGIQLTTLDEIWRFATAVSKSGLAPKGIQSPEAITVAIQMGLEVGLTPMAALQNIAVINGRPSLWGDAQLAVVRATGELEAFSEWFEQGGKKIGRNPANFTDDTACVVMVKRSGYDPMETSFSVADAKQARLWGKDGPWSQYPARMLKFRARSFALRDAFGDALRGMKTAEEMQDEPPIRQATGREVTDGSSPAPVNPNPWAENAVETPAAPVEQPSEPEPAQGLPSRDEMSIAIKMAIKEAGLKVADAFTIFANAGLVSQSDPGKASDHELFAITQRLDLLPRKPEAPAEEAQPAAATKAEAPSGKTDAQRKDDALASIEEQLIEFDGIDLNAFGKMCREQKLMGATQALRSLPYDKLENIAGSVGHIIKTAQEGGGQ